MSTAERLAIDETATATGHRFRYHLAAGFLQEDDVVIDAACGVGYGAEILFERAPINYIGVDHDINERADNGRHFISADLRTWVSVVAFDVFIGFETIEHLTDYSHYVAHAKQARRWILLSVPVVPTTHLNPHHCHNFAPGEIASLFIDQEWQLFQSILQPSELSEIYVFSRR